MCGKAESHGHLAWVGLIKASVQISPFVEKSFYEDPSLMKHALARVTSRGQVGRSPPTHPDNVSQNTLHFWPIGLIDILVITCGKTISECVYVSYIIYHIVDLKRQNRLKVGSEKPKLKQES